ncbi:hypothetical protein FHW83_002491 [Duganella sp. SG902]|uniref:hypothetical protein n=1 Tax=Duganella sp. SG902 TaxID=2587016 RepID=UPI00159D0196|nr:hypothetical protein [Duganella sp. SG902]NVM76690.1 hypothetical protein [Duganella sp. SG902]
MGWTLSVSSKGFESGKNAAAITSKEIAATICLAGAQWRFTPNADRTTSGDAGSIPAWQADKVCRNVLSTLVGFD